MKNCVRETKIETLNFADYLRKLTADLLSSYQVGSENVSLKLNLEQVYLNMDTAIPLGIIVNELVSNSLKHAFPARMKGGEIHISVCKTGTFAKRHDISHLSFHHMGKIAFSMQLL